MSIDLSIEKCFVVLTGGSRGFGRALALEFARSIAPSSAIVLVARSRSGLEETRSLVHQSAPTVRVLLKEVDLNEPIDYTDLIKSTHQELEDDQPYDRVILIHNAGTLCDVSLKMSEYHDFNYLQDYYKINLTSMILLSSAFLHHFSGLKNKSIIQISSLCGAMAYKTCGIYGIIKAARGMYLRTLALEEEDLSALSYAPGPMDTDMYTDLRTNSCDPQFNALCNQLYNTGMLARVEDSARKMVKIFMEGKHNNGEHTDYYETPVGDEQLGSTVLKDLVEQT